MGIAAVFVVGMVGDGGDNAKIDGESVKNRGVKVEKE